MPLVSCPDCGAQVSDSAVVCTQCGFPLRRDALANAPAGGGRVSSPTWNAAGIIIGLGVVGVVGIVIVGILAALAIPRFAMASKRAREADGERLLKQVFTLENTYYANTGAYASTVDQLAGVGWMPGDTARYYEPEIRLAPAGDALVCLEARPKRGADVQPLSMDSVGMIFHDAGCTGETLSQSRAPSFQPVPATDLSGEGGDAGAMTLLREVYAGVAEYRAKQGRDPTELSQVLQHVHFSRASNENSLALGRSNGRVCVSATPARSQPPGRRELSVDGEGRMYEGATCSGAVLEEITVQAVPDGAAPKPIDPTPR
jgi:Tfp pilus assembly protein PilE